MNSTNIILSKTVLGLLPVWAVMASPLDLSAHSPAMFMEVLDGEANSVIQHGVDVQTLLDSERATVKLDGPKLFARGVQAMGRSGAAPKVFLNWYQIKSPKPVTNQPVSILDPFRGDSNTRLSLGAAEFLLCPTQVITTGTPESIPDGLDFFKAYKILDAESVNAKVTVGSGESKKERVVGKPLYACISSKHWHHDEFNEATHPDQCYIVYEINQINAEEKISTMDQFGLNQFKANTTKWLCVTGSLLKTK